MSFQLPTWQQEVMMKSKLPRMLRPVHSFITRVPDSAAPICLLSIPEPPTPSIPPKYRLKPTSIRFPKSLLKSLTSQSRPALPVPHSPLPTPPKHCFLRYPKTKPHAEESLLDLDKYKIDHGKPIKVINEQDMNSEESIDSYRGKSYLKADLGSLKQLERENKELVRRLKGLRESVKKGRSESVSEVEKKESQVRGKRKEEKGNTYPHPTNPLTYNRELLYNLHTSSSIPLKDINWQRDLRRSRSNTRHCQSWTHTDPVLHLRTVSSDHFKRLYVSEPTDPTESNQSLVMTKYPYCRTCVTHSSPIRVRLR